MGMERGRDKRGGKAVEQQGNAAKEVLRRHSDFQQLRQGADTHHVCRPGWCSLGGLHKVGSPRQLMGDWAEGLPILQNKCCQFWETLHNDLHINLNQHSVILLGVSMQKSIKQTFWHHCLFTNVIMRNELILNGVLLTFTDR